MRRACVLQWILPIVLAGCMASADRDVTLEDLTLRGHWRTYAWNRAPGTVELVDEGPPGATEPSTAVTIAWPAGDEFRFFAVEPAVSRGPIPYRLRRIRLWVRGTGDAHFLEVHFSDSTGQGVKVGLGAVDFEGWRELAADIPADWSQPLRFQSVTWHNWGMKDAGGTVTTLLAGLTGTIDESDRVVPGDDEVELVVLPEARHGLAASDGVCVVQYRVRGWLPIRADFDLRATLVDEDGAIAQETATPITVNGSYAQRSEVRLPRYGCFRYVARLAAPGSGEQLAVREVGLAWPVPQPPLTEEQRARSPVGVNTHFWASWELLERIGAHWARDYSWSWLGRGETAPYGNGVDFAARLADARAHGVTVLPVLQGSFRNPEGTAFLEDATAVREGFERLAATFPSVPFWEIDNEFDYALPGGMFNVPNYVRALAAGSAGLHNAGAALMVLNGTAGIRYDLAESLLNTAAESFAVVNSHYYAGPVPPESGRADVPRPGGHRLLFVDELARISELSHNAGKQSWLTEIGWDAGNGPAVGEAAQAEYLPRAYLLSLLAGVDRVFWYFDADTDGSGIFSTCGLIRRDDSLRPAAMALAALSREVAHAKVIGTLDLGDDIWAVLLELPDGTWTIAAWSVLTEHPVPQELRASAARDIYGNPCTPAALDPTVTYFHLRSLPRGWEQGARCRWAGAGVAEAEPGGSAEACLVAPSGAVEWENLPPGVSAGPWRTDGDQRRSALSLAPGIRSGVYSAVALVRGEDWERRLPLEVCVLPPVRVEGDLTYEPNQPTVLTLWAGRPIEAVEARLVGDGVVTPMRFDLAHGRPQRVAVVPDPGAEGPLDVEFRLPNGATASVTLRPMQWRIPRPRDVRVDGDLSDWPDVCSLPSAVLAADGAPDGARLMLGWDERGLLVAATLPVRGLVPANPDWFWDFTNLEVFVEPSLSAAAWGASTRQLWFSPVRDGAGWRLSSGVWDRRGGNSARTEASEGALLVGPDAVAVEVLIPWSTLGTGPEPGEGWRVAVAARAAGLDGSWAIAWPRLKTDGLLDGPTAWGTVQFGG